MRRAARVVPGEPRIEITTTFSSGHRVKAQPTARSANAPAPLVAPENAYAFPAGGTTLPSSMLTAFTVENYRSFVEKTRVELRPLTLLFGYNNSGKSALVRALPLLAESMRPDATAPLNLNSDAAREAGFGDLVSKLGDASALRFGLEHGGELTVEYEVTRPAGSLRQSLTSVRISSPADGSMSLDIVPGPDMTGSNALYRLTHDGALTGILVQHPFSGLAPRPPFLVTNGSEHSTSGHRDACVRILQRLFSASYALTWEVLWLGSLRRYPERSVQMRDGGPQPRLLHDGAGVAELLAVDKLTGGALLSDVSAWYERGDCFRRRLDVVQSPEDRFSVVLEPLDAKRPVQVNVADTGEGIAQVLPVLLAMAMARRGEPANPRLLCFEQPELHLHTAIHAPLAEHFCGLAAMDAPPHMLIETHSENFLLGVQVQIASRKLPPERVLIYWVSQDDHGASQVHRIELDDEGYAHGFPDDVFDKDVELSRVLIEAREAAR